MTDTSGRSHYEIDKSKDMLISEEIFSFKKNVNRLKELDELLTHVKVADLAVGSGAFPLGMLNEIVRAREVLTEYLAMEMNGFQKKSFYEYERKPYDLKVNTIKNCIFACDIEPSAVDIAKLRLWLTIVIDDEIADDVGNGEFDAHTKPRQLPNLECNIICGNSLIDEFKGNKLITESVLLNNVSNNCQGSVFQSSVDGLISRLIELQDKLFFTKEHSDKEDIKDQIQNIYNDIILEQIGGDYKLRESYFESLSESSKPFVLWQLYFPRVFKYNGGFDIVIGNPPYVDSEEMTRSMPELRKLYAKKFESAKGNWDLFVLFIEQGIKLLVKNGVISFIVPNKLVSAPYTTAIRKMMASNSVREMRDYSNVNVFDTAAVYPVVFRVIKNDEKKAVQMNVMDDMTLIGNSNLIEKDKFYNDIDWDKYFNASAELLDVVDKILAFSKLETVATVNGAATVGEAYLVKEYLVDDEHLEDATKFINTGGLDKYKSFFGEEYIRYLKDKYMYPMAPNKALMQMSEKRYKESKQEKIIIGGMNKTLECLYDSGEYLAGKSTTIVYAAKHLKYITAVLNSTLMSFYYKIFFNSMSLAGGFFRVGAPQIKTLPIAIPDDDTCIARVEKMVDSMQECLSDDLFKKIDAEIYEIYGLNKHDITLIEDVM